MCKRLLVMLMIICCEYYVTIPLEILRVIIKPMLTYHEAALNDFNELYGGL